ncbi:hypothetical protein MJO29_006349 [Puccinia striiformis f. sp. tritici]|nr:hypothetical protein MJO29_006349 [Puccinia striiformis f. sp. tritici]
MSLKDHAQASSKLRYNHSIPSHHEDFCLADQVERPNETTGKQDVGVVKDLFTPIISRRASYTVADPSQNSKGLEAQSTSDPNSNLLNPKTEDEDPQPFETSKTISTGDNIQLAKILFPLIKESAIMIENTSAVLVKQYTEKLNSTNFSTWRRELFTAMSLLNLDPYLTKDPDTLKGKPDFDDKAKQATNIIRMHLDGENSARFVEEDELETYKPKELWTNICEHYATKSMENAAKLMQKMVFLDFSDGNMNTAINEFRVTFQSFLEVTAKRFEKKTVEALWIFWVLIKLPPSLSLYKTLQFSVLSSPTAKLAMTPFLSDLERELQRLAKPVISASALAVASQQQNQNYRSGQATHSPQNNNPGHQSRRTRRICENGVHNPATSHSAENCHQLHPERAVAYHQAALDRINSSGVNPKAGLSALRGVTDAIVLDSGASGHYLKHREYFVNLAPANSAVYAANGTSIPIVGLGSAVVHTSVGPLYIKEAFFAPDLSNSLIPLTYYLQRGFSLIPTHGGSRFQCKSAKDTLFVGSTTSNILLIDVNPLKALSVKPNLGLELHRALGHPSINYLKKAYPDLPIDSVECNVCDLAKMHRQPFSGSFPKLHRVLECVHMDLCGPISPASRGGNRYFLKIIDGFSKFRFIYPMRCKSQTFQIFLSFLNQVENSTNHRLKSVVSDNGGEFVNNNFAKLYSEKGITHLTTSPYTPQQNPFAERGNRTTIEKARALLLASGLGLDWWGDAVTTSVYLENRTPDSSINWASPYELWHSTKPDLQHLIPFGCRVVLYDEKKWRDSKLSPSGVEALFLGYYEGHHSYKVWVPSRDVIRNSHHIKPFPNSFPLLHTSSEPVNNHSLFNFDLLNPDETAPTITELGRPDNTPDTPPPDTNLAPEEEVPSPIEDELNVRAGTSIEHDSNPESAVNPTETSCSKKGYIYVPFYDTAPKDISSDIDPSNIIAGGRRHMAMLIVGEPSSPKDPITYAQAVGRLDGNEWLVAIGVEINNIERHEVWVVAPLVPGTKELDTVWVFKRKFDADGELLKYKARLCVRGFRQIEGVNYNHTFAPTGRVATLRLLFGLAASRDWDIQQMDVKCAFLNGIPDEDIFIKVPDGVQIDLPPGHGLKLQKSLYGLKQSPRCWYKALKDFFVSINFKPAGADPCLFIHQDPARPCFVFVHVDDMVILGRDVQFFKDHINHRFEMEDLGDCSWVLGMRVTRDREHRTISLCQDRYITEVLDEFGMSDCRPISAPLPLNALTCPIDQNPVSPAFNYRRAVGLLNYLVQCTRPDLAFTCSFLSQFLNNPTKSHENFFNHVLRYLKYSTHLSLVLGNVPGDQRLIGYSDSSHASGNKAASFSGSLVLYHGPIGWRCAKQDDDGPAISTTEAEYRACSETGQDLRWAEQLLQDINSLLNIDPTIVHLYCDNQGALALLQNPIYQHKTRHMNVRHHWLRYHIEDANNFTVAYVSTNDNPSDLLTKPLSPIKTRQFLHQLHLKIAKPV